MQKFFIDNFMHILVLLGGPVVHWIVGRRTKRVVYFVGVVQQVRQFPYAKTVYEISVYLVQHVIAGFGCRFSSAGRLVCLFVEAFDGQVNVVFEIRRRRRRRAGGFSRFRGLSGLIHLLLHLGALVGSQLAEIVD